jgi:two-component system, sensor histidine kinase and response regulator
MKRLRSSPRGRLIVLAVLLSFGPLLTLSLSATLIASNAVTSQVKDRLSGSAKVSADYVQGHMVDLADLVNSFAQRPSLAQAMGNGDPAHADQNAIKSELLQLNGARADITATRLMDVDGRVLAAVPDAPSLLGSNVASTDWYTAVTRAGRLHVSAAFVDQSLGAPQRVVAVGAPVGAHNPPGTDSQVIGVVAVEYSLATIQSFTDDFAKSNDLSLTVTDQRGVVVAAPGTASSGLTSQSTDPVVTAALHGQNGVVDRDTASGRQVSGFAPLPSLGWTLTADIPASTAYAQANDLRNAVLVITLVFGLLLVAGLWLLNWALREHERQEAELAALEKSKSDFLRLASHEFKQPLTVMKGYLGLVADGSLGELPPSAREVMPVLTDAVDGMTELVDQMLEAASLDDSRMQLRLETTDLRELVSEATRRLAPLAGATHRIVVDAPPAPLPLLVDPKRVEMILVNLIGNAIKYSPKGGEIHLELSKDTKTAAVAVSDRGIGIRAEDLPRLFTRFGRVVPPEHRQIPGTGLGLYMARELARKHGGDITAVSEAGTGSTFTLTLPLAASGSNGRN